MQVLLDALEHSKAAPRILFGILVSGVCLTASFWIMWAEVRHTEYSQVQIAKEHFELQKSLAAVLSEVRIDLQAMKNLADQIQREELQRLSGDSDFMRQWVQMRAEQSVRNADVSNRIENIEGRLGRVLDLLRAADRPPQPPAKPNKS